jgi:signal transduction histidine kinase
VGRLIQSSGRFERFVADLTSSLLNASAETLDESIRDGLGQVAYAARAERSSFARFSEKAAGALTVTHSLGKPAIPTPFRADLVWYLDQLKRGHCPTLSRLSAELPAGAAVERDVFRAMGIRAHVAVPVFQGGQVWGVIGLSSATEPHPWTADDLLRLRVAGEIIAAAMRHRELEETTRHLRDELTHVARVAALGDLTVAITHELTQPLTAIRTNGQATKRLLARGVSMNELADVLTDIVDDSTRAADLIERLAGLFRRRELAKIPVDVNQAIRDFDLIARAESRRRGSRLVLQLGSDLPKIMGDAVQIQQVLLNLVRNAAEAMAGLPPPAREVEITTLAAPPGQVTVSVGDSGPPIDDAVFERLFNAFYTTKPNGLGMGLAISRAIVEAHGGRLWAERRPAGGLLVCFTLPAQVRPAAPADALAEDAGAKPRRGRTLDAPKARRG